MGFEILAIVRFGGARRLERVAGESHKLAPILDWIGWRHGDEYACQHVRECLVGVQPMCIWHREGYVNWYLDVGCVFAASQGTSTKYVWS